MENRKLPTRCPSCENQLKVTALCCDVCSTKVEGHFMLPTQAALNDEDQLFIIEFVKNSGSLKNMANAMKLSYPTVRNKLDDLINKLNHVD